MLDYILVYKDKNKKIAAFPNKEGVYTYSGPLPEFTQKVNNNELIILGIENFHGQLKNKSGEDTLTFEYVGKLVGSAKISDGIKELGFQKFLTEAIKEYIKQNP